MYSVAPHLFELRSDPRRALCVRAALAAPTYIRPGTTRPKVPHARCEGAGSKGDGTILYRGVFQPCRDPVTHPPWIHKLLLSVFWHCASGSALPAGSEFGRRIPADCARPKGDALKKQIETGSYPGIVKTTLDGVDQRAYLANGVCPRSGQVKFSAPIVRSSPFEDGTSRHHASFKITPKRHQQLACQRHDGDAADAAFRGTDTRPEPDAQIAVGLIAQPQPGEFDPGGSPLAVAGLSEPLDLWPRS